LRKKALRENSAVSNGVELLGVSVVLGSPSDRGERSEDELESGVPLADLV
jgi:hypothetical protein